jgi:hypothetical protein
MSAKAELVMSSSGRAIRALLVQKLPLWAVAVTVEVQFAYLPEQEVNLRGEVCWSIRVHPRLEVATWSSHLLSPARRDRVVTCNFTRATLLMPGVVLSPLRQDRLGERGAATSAFALERLPLGLLGLFFSKPVKQAGVVVL